MQKTQDSPLAAPLAATLALAALIGFLTLTPIQNPGVPGTDKSHHLIGFAALALPLSFSRPRLAPWVVLAAIAYGGAIEIIQPYVGRSGEVLDLAADAMGAVLGGAAGVGLRWLRGRLQ
ncbi:MAG: VanZ family protein [Aestuariivirga sp.]|uniref:VanZ family protein n=1 Tax=Aestuariivirga sp. TaxID=2650926 RepID=UPI0030161ACF